MNFKMDEGLKTVFLGKAIYNALFMLPNPLYQIGRHTNIQGAVTLTCQDVHTKLLTHCKHFWIPASAGMTGLEPKPGGPWTAAGYSFQPLDSRLREDDRG